MFLVQQTMAERHEYVSRFMDGDDASIAVLLAAADFERCIRRAILGLGMSPTKEIRENFFRQHFHGPRRFKEVWRIEVKPRIGRNLADEVVPRWDSVERAYSFRHRLIHGIPGKLSPELASGVARTFLKAAVAVGRVAGEHGVDLDRTIRRYKRIIG